jgi:hypothetical protein
VIISVNGRHALESLMLVRVQPSPISYFLREVIMEDWKKQAQEIFKAGLTTKTTFHIHYTNVENLINAYFKNENHHDDYSIPSGEDQYASYMHVPVSGNAEDGFCKFDKAIIDCGQWPKYTISEFLNTLCFLKVIEPGDYIIDVNVD